MENQTTINTPPPLPSEIKSRSLPGFVLGFVLADLVLCSLGAIGSFVQIAQMIVGEASTRFYPEIFELIISFVIIPFGISADTMIILKKAFGVKLAYISIIADISLIIMNICNIYLGFLPVEEGIPAWIMIIIPTLMMISQTIFLYFYWKAVSKAKKFFIDCAKPEEIPDPGNTGNQSMVIISLPVPDATKPKSCNLPIFVNVFVTADLAVFLLLSSCFLYTIMEMLLGDKIPVFGIFDLPYIAYIIFSISGDIMILYKKALGIKFAFINISVSAFIMIRIFYTIISEYMQKPFNLMDNVEPNLLNTSIIFLTIFIFASLIIGRCVLLVFYCYAIKKAKAFFKECAKAEESKI